VNSLRDVVAGADLTVWPQVALVLFFAIFLGIVVYLAVRGERSWDRMRRLPLDDGKTAGADDLGAQGRTHGR